MSFGNVLATVVENIAYLFPFRQVYQYEQGIRWTLGRPSNNKFRGWYWKLWIIQAFDKVETTANIIDLGPQVVQTADNLACTIRAGVEFRVANAKALYLNLQDDEIEKGMPTVAVIARGIVADAFVGEVMSELKSNKGTVEENIAAELQVLVKRFGLLVLNIHIAEIAETKCYRIYGNSEQLIME